MLKLCYFYSTEACINFIFFFQAEDGIRDLTVTGVQTCALPISSTLVFRCLHDTATFALRSLRAWSPRFAPAAVRLCGLRRAPSSAPRSSWTTTRLRVYIHRLYVRPAQRWTS